MFDRASKKLGLEQAVLGTFEKEDDDDKPSQEEMEQLLKKGAYALLGDDNDDVTKEFCSDDIDSILAKRTRTRVVEGAKTASWLNKQGMVVSRSKFGAETGGENLDMDDPLFWQKVMPDFVTPSLLLQKFRELEDEIEGRKRGPGRGRWRQKRAEEAAAKAAAEASPSKPETEGTTTDIAAINGGDKSEDAAKTDGNDAKEGDEMHDDSKNDADDAAADASDDDDGGGGGGDDGNPDDASAEQSEGETKKKKTKLSKTNIRKLNKFMSELKSMMEAIEDEDDDEEGLSPEEKAACQKLLLTVSVKEKLFTEAQRRAAKKYLENLEGDRRRRCRTSEQTRFQPGIEEDEPTAIREELRITGKKKRKRRTREEMEAARLEAANKKGKRRSSNNSGGYVGEDGYLHHSDSEDDWSTVGDDIYQSSKKDRITRKQANQRRAWGTGDDQATAASRAWPVFPRPLVKKVLTTVLEKVMAYDEEAGGVFSVPVPKDDFPEYYEQIKKPMDYGTMKAKLENGEYRSAQAMQKDFLLIMNNCREFNANSSDIVKAARMQHLLRPQYLKEAAAKHNLFLAEDGSVLEISDDKPGSAKKKKGGKKRNKAEDENDAVGEPPKKKVGRGDHRFGVAILIVMEQPQTHSCFFLLLLALQMKKGKKSVSKDDDEADKKKPAKKAKGKKKPTKDESDEENDIDGEDGDSKKKSKPRVHIRIKASAAKSDKKTKATKRKRGADDDGVGGMEDSDVEPNPQTKKRKKNSGKASAKKKHAAAKKEESSDESDDDVPLRQVAARKGRVEASKEKEDEPESVFLDLAFWKSSRESLDGSFKAARKNLLQCRPWSLPPSIPDDKFAEVAYIVLDKMNK